MNTIFLIALSLLTACSTTKKAQYKEEKSPKFASSRSFIESPEVVRRAAKAVLEEISKESDPPAVNAVREEGDTVDTGWVYSQSKDKYVVYDFNGAPRRKILSVRRKYAYTVTSSLSGSQVTTKVDEEIESVDLKTGQPTGWKNVAPDQNSYDFLVKRLREKIRQQ